MTPAPLVRSTLPSPPAQVRRLLPGLASKAVLWAIAVVVLAGGLAWPAPAEAAEQGVGFGTWAPISAYGWHGSMLVDGVHTYCITPGAPAPTGHSTDHGISGSAAGLSPQQLAGINLLVSAYGQTEDPVQAAAVAWAVKAIANREETLHAFGYRGDSLAGAIHWTFSALAPQVDRAVQERAVAYYDEATRVTAGAATASGTISFSTDAADHRRGTVRVDANVAAHGSVTLVDAVFADSGSPTRDAVSTGVAYAILTAPPAEGRPYSVSGSGHFTAGMAAAVRHYTTPGGQQTAGPAGTLSFDVAGADAAPRVPPFAPSISTQVPARYAGPGPYADQVTFVAQEDSWPRGEDGRFLPVVARATVYRTDAEPAPGTPTPDPASAVGTLELTTDPLIGPEAAYAVASEWAMEDPGFYTAVWSVHVEDQTAEVAAHTDAGFSWTEQFGQPTQVAVVTEITTEAMPVGLVGEAATDTIHLTGGIPADGLDVRSALFRAVDGVAPADSCTPGNLIWQSESTHVAGPGDHVVTSPALSEPGAYYWQETAVDSAGTVVHIGECGLEAETTRIVAPAPQTPSTTPPPAVVPAPAPAPPPAVLAATGRDENTLRLATALAVVLVSLGVALTACRRTRARGIRHG